MDDEKNELNSKFKKNSEELLAREAELRKQIKQRKEEFEKLFNELNEMSRENSINPRLLEKIMEMTKLVSLYELRIESLYNELRVLWLDRDFLNTKRKMKNIDLQTYIDMEIGNTGTEKEKFDRLRENREQINKIKKMIEKMEQQRKLELEEVSNELGLAMQNRAISLQKMGNIKAKIDYSLDAHDRRLLLYKRLEQVAVKREKIFIAFLLLERKMSPFDRSYEKHIENQGDKKPTIH